MERDGSGFRDLEGSGGCPGSTDIFGNTGILGGKTDMFLDTWASGKFTANVLGNRSTSVKLKAKKMAACNKKRTMLLTPSTIKPRKILKKHKRKPSTALRM